VYLRLKKAPPAAVYEAVRAGQKRLQGNRERDQVKVLETLVPSALAMPDGLHGQLLPGRNAPARAI
jgi:hypothetical protein